MSLLERKQKCLPCAGRGIDRQATHGTACDDCWRESLKSRLLGRSENTMAERKNIDWTAVQKERDAGATTTALADKYGLSTPTICAHTHRSPNAIGRKPAGGKQLQRSGSANGVTHEGMQLPEIIAGLKKRRDVLTVAIDALEG